MNLKIATMVRGYIPAPRPKDIIYAPIDLAVAVAEGMQRRGHQIDFYGPVGTKLKSGVQDLGLRPLARNQEEFRQVIDNLDLLIHQIPGLWDGWMAQEMFKQAAAGRYDVLHFHHLEVGLPYARLFPEVPVVYTLHDPLNEWHRELIQMYLSPNQHLVSISDNQRSLYPDLTYATTVHDGIDTNLFTFSEQDDDYLLFVGRIVPEKGAREAVEVARRTGHKLLIIGPVFPDHQKYFDTSIKPYLGDQIQYHGLMAPTDLVKYFQRAKAFLMPISWEEPFGLTMVEAMACGTPVVGFRRGSVPELVVDGKTGFVVDTIDEMVTAVGRLGEIKPADCREHVVKNYSHEQMVVAYERVYQAVTKP
jgi:glycosyltransferase involved in cell wall biosynthesis